mmetsp:Transcript_2710/g.4227  ORF Transcript_2710/g.4227 Transcript_2710/m.4227 type:complete len:364 (-) Transcript_2710:33-1124(-)
MHSDITFKNEHRETSLEKPKPSFKWLLERDASELIEVDLPDVPKEQELLIENTTSRTLDFSKELESIYSNFQPQRKTKSEFSAATYESLDQIPEFHVLCKQIHIKSEQSFDWLSEINAEEESIAVLEAGAGIESDSSTRGIYSAMLSWVNNSLDEEEWVQALRSVYFMFAHDKINEFYVIFNRHVCKFMRNQENTFCVISNPNSQLKKNLRKFQVMIQLEETESDHLVKPKSGKKLPPIKLQNLAVHSFYNFLLNNYRDSTILAPKFFINAALRTLKVTHNGELRNFSIPELSPNSKFRQKVQHQISFKGIITPQAVLKFCHYLEKVQPEFSIQLVQETASDQLGDFNPKYITYKGSSYEVTL